MAELLTPHGVDMATRGLDLAGVCAAALQGGAIARTERLDLFGFVAVGVVSGLGGGLIRDTLLQHGTPVALTDVFYLPTALAGAFVAFLIHISQEAWDRLFTALDAAVIGFWAVAGAQKTLAAGLGWLPALLLGTITAVGGGALRDMMLRRVPAVLGGNALYASVAVVAAAITVVCSYAEQPTLGIVLGVTVALVLRLTAYRRGWGLPSGLEWQPRSRLANALRRGPWRESRTAAGRGGRGTGRAASAARRLRFRGAHPAPGSLRRKPAPPHRPGTDARNDPDGDDTPTPRLGR
ncbi:trimeric intracellular cation channel family protein [Streptomyces flavofungini]|uniref:trimeric intracellular cation channel family protein n=1 Tax=Streptomyces flavofungini TaxID=68200 RepID=UPI0025AF2B15|nr:TRIC cation channel family protein [Streptomyces flavofungini]WJV50344.1 TRIC cation channel family protein [Streptomyces flavofungini]